MKSKQRKQDKLHQKAVDQWRELCDLKLMTARKRVELITGWNQQRINYLLNNKRTYNVSDYDTFIYATKQAIKDVEFRIKADKSKFNKLKTNT